MRSHKFHLIAAALLAIGSLSVQAQTSTTTTLPGTTTTTGSIAPAPAPIGLSVTGWQLSSSIGQGYNLGGDGKGVVNTLADGFFRLGAESYLTGNSNPDCKTDCGSTQAKLFIIGEQMTGARSTNQGTGTQAAPVSSIAGTQGMFSASLQTKWVYTQPPTTTPPAP